MFGYEVNLILQKSAGTLTCWKEKGGDGRIEGP